MNPKITVSINKTTLTNQISAALQGVAAALGQALGNAQPHLPANELQISTKQTKLSHEFIYESTGNITALQQHEGTVLKDGTRLVATPWTVTAQNSTNLPQEFHRRF